MAGDDTNDAPSLAQADFVVAMNSGTPTAKDAGNMVDLECREILCDYPGRLRDHLSATKGVGYHASWETPILRSSPP
jgi:hypothetical protein